MQSTLASGSPALRPSRFMMRATSGGWRRAPIAPALLTARKTAPSTILAAASQRRRWAMAGGDKYSVLPSPV